MTRCQSRWVNVIIIALVVILRSPTLLPSMCTSDEGYYGTIANDILDGGDGLPHGGGYEAAGHVLHLRGRFPGGWEEQPLLRFTSSPSLSSQPPPWSLRRIGARVADDWAGAWSGIGYAVFVHAYRPGDTLGANSEIFALSSARVECSCLPQGAKKAGLGFDVPQRRAGRGGDFDPAAFGRDLGRNAGVSRLRLAHSPSPIIRTCFGSRQRCRDWIHRGDCGTGLVLPVAGKSA